MIVHRTENRLRFAAGLSGLAVLLLVLVSCASVSKDQCAGGNWRDIGFTDGAKGRPTGIFNNHINACKGLGVTPDQSAWSAGYVQGLKSYCVPSNMHAAGMRGLSFPKVCAAQQDSLQASWEWGHKWWELDREIRVLRMDLRGSGNLPSDFALGPAEIRRKQREQYQYAFWPPR